MESLSPSFIEAILKASRQAERGITTTAGKVLFDDKGRSIQPTPGETAIQTLGFRPERLARESGKTRTRQNVEQYFNAKRQDIYDRMALAQGQEARRQVIMEAQRFNLETQKYRGWIRPINANSLRQSVPHRITPWKRQVAFGQIYGEESPP